MAYEQELFDDCFAQYSAAPTQDTLRRILYGLEHERGMDLQNLMLMAGALSVRMRKTGNSCFPSARQYEAFIATFSREAKELAVQHQKHAAEVGSDLEKGAQGARR